MYHWSIHSRRIFLSMNLRPTLDNGVSYFYALFNMQYLYRERYHVNLKIKGGGGVKCVPFKRGSNVSRSRKRVKWDLE